MSVYYVNTNTYPVRIQDETGRQVTVFPYVQNIDVNDERCYFVTGEHFKKFVDLKMLSVITDLSTNRIAKQAVTETKNIIDDEPEDVEEEDVEEEDVEEEDVEEEDVEEEDDSKKPDAAILISKFTEMLKRELVDECNKYNLDTNGNRETLIARLLKHNGIEL